MKCGQNLYLLYYIHTSMFVKLTYLNGSPTGLIHNTTCRLARTRSTKNANIPCGVSSTPCALAMSCKLFFTSSNSSGLYRFGTSPLLRMLLMSSRKLSSTTCVSLKRKTVGLLSTPAWKYRRFKSADNSQYVNIIQQWFSTYRLRAKNGPRSLFLSFEKSCPLLKTAQQGSIAIILSYNS